MKNPFGRTVPVEKPYAIYKSHLMPGWTWHICKTYQSPGKEGENRYARWFTWVKSEFTYGQFEGGDTYVRDILEVAEAYLVEATPEWKKHYE